MGGRGLWALFIALFTTSAHAGAARHVASPDWRDQIIYFVMIDRFDDGEPRNSDQHAGEFNPGDGAHYSGGDLVGLTRRLDYIKGLGATSVWITPPVAHQWWNTRANYGGYHGYWADDFSRVDAHFGTLDDYRALATGLHARGMFLVQDIVVNHVADYFRYNANASQRDPVRGYVPVPDASGRTAPLQPPFNLNDPRRPRDRRAAIYHWTPDISNYADPRQLWNWQLAGLDDLNTENPRVRGALRAAYGQWIRDVGVDAFRVDTAFYVPPAFFADFLHSKDPVAPGILEVARATGRRDFHVFGEGFARDLPFRDTQSRRIENYVEGGVGMPAMINFPLYGTLADVLQHGRPTAELGDRIGRMLRVHARPQLMPTFLDNHDVDRFRAAGSEAALRQGLLALMTLPGIPTIYYGTEQGFEIPRASMFAAGWGSGGRDHFDTTTDGYRYLARVSELRRGDVAWSRGLPTVLAANAAGPGALVYRVDHGSDTRLVAINTSDHAVLVDAFASGMPALTRLAPVFAIEGQAPDLGVDAGGRLQLLLPARSGYAWATLRRAVSAPATRQVLAKSNFPPTQGSAPQSTSNAASSPPSRLAPLHPGAPTLAPIPARIDGELEVSGSADAPVQLVVDGDLATARTAVPRADGRWQQRLHTDDFVDPRVQHRVVAFDPATQTVSVAREFRVARRWWPAGSVADPSGDDHGPAGTSRYPTDPDWRGRHPADLQRVAAATSGGALQLDVSLRELLHDWNAPNGFDHLALTVFIELPGQPAGATAMPLQHGSLPQGMRWHRRLRVGGWVTALFSSEGADATHEGRPLAAPTQLSVDAARRTLRLTLPASALGSPTSLRGARVYVTSWDFDSGYRALTTLGGAQEFGGETGSAKVMDDALLVLAAQTSTSPAHSGNAGRGKVSAPTRPHRRLQPAR